MLTGCLGCSITRTSRIQKERQTIFFLIKKNIKIEKEREEHLPLSSCEEKEPRRKEEDGEEEAERAIREIRSSERQRERSL